MTETYSNRRFLAVDQGNSFLKLSLFEDGSLSDTCRIAVADAERIFGVVDSWRPDCGVFCTVKHLDPRIVESLRMALGGNLLVFSHTTPLPFKVDYSTPSTLGLDRLALASGALCLYPEESVVIVDAGTAVTLDVMSYHSSAQPDACRNDAPVFFGGRIAPGIGMRFESLHHFTDALPLVNAFGELPLTGHSTDTSIRSGVILGLADEIVETFRQYSEIYGCSRLLLTGGDAELLIKLISSRIPAVHVPDLMANGLLYIYNYNEI